MKKSGGLFFILGLILVGLTFLGKWGSPNPPENPVSQPAGIQVTDFRNKPVHLEKPAQRIVCLIESALTGFYMLEARDQIAGVPVSAVQDPMKKYYAVLDPRIGNKSLPAPGNWDFINLESVLALKPDLVVIWREQKEAISLLENQSVPVYGVFISSFQDIEKEIRDFGLLTGRTARADSLLKWSDQQATEQVRMKNEPVPKVYFTWNQGLLETSGRPGAVTDLIELAGGENCISVNLEHTVISLETLLVENPDVILMWSDPNRNPETVLSLPEIRKVKAVQNKAVYELPSPFYCDFWTLKYHLAVQFTASVLHPERKNPVLSETWISTFNTRFYGPAGKNLPLD